MIGEAETHLCCDGCSSDNLIDRVCLGLNGERDRSERTEFERQTDSCTQVGQVY